MRPSKASLHRCTASAMSPRRASRMPTLISILVNVTRVWRGGLFLLASTLLVNAAWAAGPDVCAALPLAKVNSIIHQNLTGVRPDVSEEAHSYGCSSGSEAHV